MHTFTGSIDGTFAPGVGTVSPVSDSPTQVEPVVGTLDAHARLALRIPPPALPVLTRRTMPGVVLTMPTPAVHRGAPRIPKRWAQLAVTATAQAGVGHLRAFPDPDPVWNGSAYDVAPPPVSAAGAHLIRWSARTLPDPSTFPGGHYALGAASTQDGTSSIAAAARQWAAAPGSSYALPWTSSWPFKPTVQNHIHYGSDGSVYTESAGVHFTPAHVTQMWCDFGTVLTPPFTMLIVALVSDFPSPSWTNTIFDAGEDPGSDVSFPQRVAIAANGLSGSINLTESYGYRNLLRAGRSQLQTFTDPVASTRVARVPFTHTLKPKVMAVVINGSASMLYIRDATQRHLKRQAMSNHGAQRLWVMGRQGGVLSPLAACSMVAFEVRAWDKALTEDDLDAQYAPLSSTWKFGSYR